MTFACNGLPRFRVAPPWPVIAASWFVALIECILQVPGNQIGHGHFPAPKRKTIREVITPMVFSVFSVTCLKEPWA